jgi:hypothetical protein
MYDGENHIMDNSSTSYDLNTLSPFANNENNYQQLDTDIQNTSPQFFAYRNDLSQFDDIQNISQTCCLPEHFSSADVQNSVTLCAYNQLTITQYDENSLFDSSQLYDNKITSIQYNDDEGGLLQFFNNTISIQDNDNHKWIPQSIEDLNSYIQFDSFLYTDGLKNFSQFNIALYSDGSIEMSKFIETRRLTVAFILLKIKLFKSLLLTFEHYTNKYKMPVKEKFAHSNFKDYSIEYKVEIRNYLNYFLS